MARNVLVNTAGRDRMGWFLVQDPARWDHINDVTLRGQSNWIRAAGDAFLEADGVGSIVAIDSDPAESLVGRIESQTPLGRLTDPADVAGAVASLPSDDAAFVTGRCPACRAD